MRLLKKLLLLVVLVAIAALAQAAWQSPYWALWQIDRGLDDKDVAKVERYADLEQLVQASAQVVGALAAEQVGVGGEDIGSRLLGALVGAVADRVGREVSANGAAELRRAVAQGRVTRALGPFTVNPGWRALGPLSRSGDRAVVEVKGRCGDNDARLGLVFQQRAAATFGADVGWPSKWVLVGVDPESVKVLARTCRSR